MSIGTRDLEYHQLACIFPLIEGEAFGALVDDVRERGVIEDVWLLDGKILDGRNRYRASKIAGRPLEKWQFKTFESATMGDPLAWVLSKNLHRRHLDESQRAAVGARLASLKQGQKKEEVKPANLPVSSLDTTPQPEPAAPAMTQAEAAAAVNVSERSVRDAGKVLKEGTPDLIAAVDRGEIAVSTAAKALVMEPSEQDKVAALAKDGNGNAVRTVVKRAARAAKEIALGAEQRALPDRQFGVIYADPEWRWEPYSRETGMDRAADNHYPTSTTEEIMARGVPAIAAPDSVLFLWATAPMLPDALRVMEAWGFGYKSHVVWAKERHGEGRGPGYWFTGEHELLLVGTRGDIPAPAPGTQWRSVITAPVGEHSEKPAIFAQMIEEYYPSLPRIELNAREKEGQAPRPGWEFWGNEAPPPVEIGTLAPVARNEEFAARLKAVTDESGLVYISESHAVAAEFIVDGELEEAEAYARRAQGEAAKALVTGEREPRWKSHLMAPTVLAEAAAPAAPAPPPSINDIEIPAYLLRQQPSKETA